MKPETFFDNFEALAEAPNGVQKLREMILQLAFQGMLVQKDEKDEQVTVLIKKIKDERERLIRENKIKKDVVLPPINLNEIPFIIPKSWVWVRLSEICPVITDGEHLTPKYSDSGVPLLSAKNIGQKDLDFSDVNYVTEGDAQSFWSRCKPEKGDILVVSRGGGVGRTIISNKNDFCLMGSVLLFKVSEHYLNKFLYYFLRSTIGNERLRTASGATAQPAIYILHLKRNYLVPLCPSNEQHRIVSKVDQLMSICDELESRQQKKRETRAHLNSAALDRLLAARAPGEFAEEWRCIYDNFDVLYDAPENVGALRQAILQLAVMGKLVEQDERDEPAAVLLEKIKAEKERLIKDKKIKRYEHLVEPSDVPFELPKGWNWISLGNALLKLTDGTHNSPPNYENGDFKYVTAKNIKNKGIDLTNITYVTTAIHNEIYSRCDPEPGDILYIKDGATTGIAAINDITDPFSMLSSVALLKTPTEIYNRYLLYILRSPYFYSMMRDDMSGVAITRVTLTKLNKALIPLAPLEEQRRIVARVDLLMSLCDNLEAGLMRSQADGERLMEAVVGRMLAGGDGEHGAE